MSNASGRSCARRPRSPQPHDIHFFATPEELRDWFDANHETADELWVGYYRKATGRPSVDWSQAVDEALCVGWIDGVRRSLDESRFVQRFTPRRKGSTWSAVNVAKVEALTSRAGCVRRDRRLPGPDGGEHRDLLMRARGGRASRPRRRHGFGRTPSPGPTGRRDRRPIGVPSRIG